MASDPAKKAAFACTYIIVCAGEQGEQIISEAGLLGEMDDYDKILKCLEDSVNPSSNFLEDSVNYFYLKQGDMSVRQFQREAEQLIERMIPNYDVAKSLTHKEVKALMLRNLLLVGLRHKGVLKECHRLKQGECTAAKILELAYQAEIRDTANQRMAQNFMSSNQTSALQEMAHGIDQSPVHRIGNRSGSRGPPTTSMSKTKTCKWCGGAQLCKRSACPAFDKECSYCHKMGHFARVCQQKRRSELNDPSAPAERRKLHNVEMAEIEESDEDPGTVYGFNQLNDVLQMSADHIKPIWISVPDSPQVHKVNVEIDTGAACNIMPNYTEPQKFCPSQLNCV